MDKGMDENLADDARIHNEIMDLLSERIIECLPNLQRAVARHYWNLASEYPSIRKKYDPEDILQEALLRVSAKAHEYRPEYPAFAWIMKFVIHILRDCARHERIASALQYVPRPVTSSHDGDEGENQDTVEDFIERYSDPHAEERYRLTEILDVLDEESRILIFRRFYQNEKVNTIAASLGITPGSVSVKIYRILERCRSMDARQHLKRERK